MKIKELLSDSSKWTQHTTARDSHGKMVEALHRDAQKWCLAGAWFKCYPGRELIEFSIMINKALGRESHYGVTTWNDNEKRTFEEVKELVEKLDV